MPDKGWIKLHRKILDCWIWQDKPYDKARAWIDLLLLAMHHDKKLFVDNEILVVERGSFMTSTVKLADRWGWSRSKVLRYLELLESERMLNTKRTPKGTLVTIVNYGDYQLSDATRDTAHDTTVNTSDDTTHATAGETPGETSVDTQNKNIKNVKNIKNKYMCAFENVWAVYPRKINKGAAYKCYLARINSGFSDGELMQATKNYADECKKNRTDQKYIKHGATFFGSSTPFVDYLDKNYSGGGSSGRTGRNDAAVKSDAYADALYGAIGNRN